MIYIDIYNKLFEKYEFDIHEAFDTKKWGKLKFFIREIKQNIPTDNDIKYTTKLGHVVELSFLNGDIYIIINGVSIRGLQTREILKLLELEEKYY